ncbi:MAG: cytochrome c [Myxococcota bacterium]
MKKLLKVLGALVVLVLLSGMGSFLWAKSAASARLERHFDTHRVDFPIPFPLTEAEVAELRAEKAKALPPDADPNADVLAGVDLGAVALERAKARGKHLIEARYACIECHAKDFGGGTMLDSPPIGRLFGMNLTAGKGGVVAKYTAADWDRIVRHGVLPDGRPTAMPSLDYVNMSDQELSDVIAYVRAAPPVDREMARPTLGPVGTLLMASGKIVLSAEHVDHQKTHAPAPPTAAPTAEFGKHLVAVCAGCHNPELTGGVIQGGAPDWAPAANLTPHADGLAGWTYEDFVRALREGKAKDGRQLKPPMDGMKPYAANLTDTELQGMWAYLQTLPPKPDPKP